VFPENELSTEYRGSPIVGAQRNYTEMLIDFEDGGIALNDPSEGYLYQRWTGIVTGNKIYFSAPNTESTLIYTGTNITEMSFTFDQNMNPAIAMIDAGNLNLYWYDSTIEDMTTTTFNGTMPRIALDDKRRTQNASNDVVFIYVRNGVLYMRVQRDRYGVEYTLKSGVTGTLHDIGMGRNWRMQIVFNPYTI
jgi:hypothetical protein